MEQSESISKLAAALVKAQSEMPEIPMDGLNPHYKSKFSTLGAVIKATRPVFTANGLCVLQLPSGQMDEVGLTTRIVHVSGEWIESELVMKVPSGANRRVTSSPSFLGTILPLPLQLQIAVPQVAARPSLIKSRRGLF